MLTSASGDIRTRLEVRAEVKELEEHQEARRTEREDTRHHRQQGEARGFVVASVE